MKIVKIIFFIIFVNISLFAFLDSSVDPDEFLKDIKNPTEPKKPETPKINNDKKETLEKKVIPQKTITQKVKNENANIKNIHVFDYRNAVLYFDRIPKKYKWNYLYKSNKFYIDFFNTNKYKKNILKYSDYIFDNIRFGIHRDFVRVVFDFNKKVDFNIKENKNKNTILIRFVPAIKKKSVPIKKEIKKSVHKKEKIIKKDKDNKKVKIKSITDFEYMPVYFNEQLTSIETSKTLLNEELNNYDSQQQSIRDSLDKIEDDIKDIYMQIETAEKEKNWETADNLTKKAIELKKEYNNKLIEYQKIIDNIKYKKIELQDVKFNERKLKKKIAESTDGFPEKKYKSPDTIKKVKDKKEQDKADSAAIEKVKKYRKLADKHFGLALGAIQKGNYKKALEELKEMLKYDATNLYANEVLKRLQTIQK